MPDGVTTVERGATPGDGHEVVGAAVGVGTNRVRGVVHGVDGSPIIGVGVVAYAQRLRQPDGALGKAVTGVDGSYTITYRAPSPRVDLFIRASHDGTSATSPVIVGVGPDETIDLVLGGAYVGPSDYTRLHDAIAPVLAEAGTTSVADFTEAEIAMLSAKSGADPSDLVFLRQTAALAAKTRLSTELFYSLGRQRVPLTLAGVMTTDPKRRRDAVAAAVAANQVPPALKKQLDDELGKLDQLAVQEALRGPIAPGESTLGALLGVAGLTTDKQYQLVGLHVAAGGDPAAFWKTVREKNVLAAAQIDQVQDALRVNALVLGHVPLVQALRAKQRTKPVDLATLERADWQALVSGVGMPPDLTAAGVTPVAYVDQVVRLVEDAVPVARIAARASHLPGGALLSQFFAKNPSYDLRSTPVRTYLRANPDALAFLPDDATRATFTRQLQGVERIYRIAPPGARLAVMEELLAAGVASAQAIRAMGKPAFQRRFTTALGADVVEATWARASNAAALATALVAQHGAAFAGPPMRMLPVRAASIPEIADYTALFGSPDACACSDCQSLGSPAAYLVDVLHWLDQRPTTSGGTGASVLLDPGRRADLATVELSCANTTTVLPQIDLAIELLELAVAPPASPPGYQTRGAAEDLRAQPEHVHSPAYAVLAGADPTQDAVYPFSLPYDLWLDEARTYLGQLGLSRADLMTALHEGSPSDALAEPSVAAELVGMSPVEWDVIAGKPLVPSRAPAAFWGLAGDPNWVTTLTTVASFLARALPGATRDTAYAALTDWLRTDFVQAAGDLGLWFDDASCDTTKASLAGLTAAHLDRIHRFARLQRRLGWSAADLDRAITVLGGGALDEACLIKLAIVRRLTRAIDAVSLAELLTWWGPLDTRRWAGRLLPGRPKSVPITQPGTGFAFSRLVAPVSSNGDDQSFYDARFQSRSVGAAPDPAFQVASDGGALLDETQPLVDHAAAVAAALGITAADLAALAPRLPNDRLTLANLLLLFRHVSLARALGASIPSLVALLTLAGAVPLEPAAPAATLAFVDEARTASSSSLSLDELGYLLRDVDTQPPTLAPSDAAVGVILLALRDALRRVPIDQPDSTQQPAASRSIVIDKLGAALRLNAGLIAPLLDTYVRSPIDGTTPALAVFLDRALTEYAGVDQHTGAPVLPTPSDLPGAFATYRRLHKVALLIARLRLGADELPWVCQTGPATGTLDLNTLPVSPGTPAASYAAWTRLRDAVRARDGLLGRQLFDLFLAAANVPSGDAAAIDAAYAALLDALEKRTRWTRADIETLVGAPAQNGQPPRPSALGLAYPADWISERGFDRVARAMGAITRVGLAADTAWPWRAIPAAIDAREAQATAIRQAVRARYADPAEWRAIAGPLRDALRERQRDALVAWLVAHDQRFADAEDLYGHFLIDVLSSPCQLTSRIRQAMSSAQQFVQRALIGLELEVELTPDDVTAWTTWRKTYRLWEANRKVFLYPENWIDPSLRDDKTPLFVALEQSLAQGEITAETTEAAVIAYLHGLDDLARLEIVGVLHQHDDAGDVLHVFGRTRNTPRRYFYRTRLAGVRWTPWEAMDVDIEGDHLLPVLFQGRLYVFWAQFSVAAVEADVVATPTGPGVTTAAAPLRYYQIRLVWSQRKDGAWVGRTLSTEQVGATDADFYNYSSGLKKTAASTPADFFFRTFEDQGDLVIEPVRRWAGEQDVAPAEYVRIERFRLSGCDGTLGLEQVVVTSDPSSWKLPLVVPPGTVPANQAFDSNGGSNILSLPARNPSTSALEDDVALDHMDGSFAIVPPHVDDFHSEDVFVVQDRRRTFHVAPALRHWFRPPAAWLQPDGISIEPLKLYAETKRPLVPRPDPRLLDRSIVMRAGARVGASTAPALASANGASVVGLPAVGANELADMLGPRVASLGGGTVTPRSPSLALLGRTDILSASGQLLLSVRSAGAPPATSALRALTIDNTLTVPPLEIADPVMGTVLTSWDTVAYRFEELYHPYVCRLLRQVQRFGVAGLYDPSPTGPEPLLRRQQLSDDFFAASYVPATVAGPYPRDEIDFSFGGAYSAYNWEVFFHVPFAIACQLSANRQFADAQRWFHYVFDPTATDGDLTTQQRCWKFRPFFELFDGPNADVGPIADLLLLLDYAGTDPAKLARRDELIAQITASQERPFDPDAIARVRIVAYAKAIVIKYIENLIAWGDQLFAQDTRETVDEATQLYVLAAQILGPRPATIPAAPFVPQTFAQLRARVDPFGDAEVTEVEGYLPDVGDAPIGDADTGAPPPLTARLYFRVPPNDTLVARTWDVVADRLFKIRHCLDIAGKAQQLPLFEPPIDPGLLVRAQAAGIDLASALRDITAPQPIHRYAVLAQKASELCAEVRGLGQTMLAALEKQDGEALALLRADHEVTLFSAMRQVRAQQVDEANQTVDGLRRAREAADRRVQYYRSRELMNEWEKRHLELAGAAAVLETAATVTLQLGTFVAGIPDTQAGGAGFGGSPLMVEVVGGTQIHRANQAAADALSTLAHLSDRAASLAGVYASYQRRKDDWQLQGDVAEKDRDTLDKQILAAEIRVAIAEHELDNLDLQIAQAREVDDQLRSKYTNQELYSWMVGQLASIYFQGYQLAYSVAKRAEKAWQFELAQPKSSFIDFGYWDSLKKGLLAGERLAHDLRRMDVAYLDQHQREYELVAQVSLKLLDPAALERLKTKGECDVSIPEYRYDLDSPGHYLRRLKSVAVSLPCVGGPYVPVRCTLTLTASSARTSTDTQAGYPRKIGSDDSRFYDDHLGLQQSIVTSRADEDAGLFETNLRDERYLPFEGAGAISSWHLELPKQFRPFDYDTITDVVLHVRYTARAGGDALRAAAEASLLPMLQGLALGVSLRDEMSDLFEQFLQPESDASDQAVALSLDKDRFPFFLRGNSLTVTAIDVFLLVEDLAAYQTAVRLELTAPGGIAQPIALESGSDFGGVPHAHVDLSPTSAVGSWTLAFLEAENASASATVVTADGHRRLDPAAVRDVIFVFRYQAG